MDWVWSGLSVVEVHSSHYIPVTSVQVVPGLGLVRSLCDRLEGLYCLLLGHIISRNVALIAMFLGS